MSLKTREFQLRDLGLGDFAIVYDDDESELDDNSPETAAIAWLYSAYDGHEYGHWNANLSFVSKVDVPQELPRLTAVLEEMRR